MKIKITLSIVLLTLSGVMLKSQSDTYVIKKTPFSSGRYDEFAPVFYKNGLVFGSNRGSSSLVAYSDDTGKGLVSLFFVEQDRKGKWKKPKLFSKDLNTQFNDGPATFNEKEDNIYYSRNMFIINSKRKSSFYQNKLGLFSAIKINGKWINISPFRHNNDWFNISTPSLSPDGKRLFFSSDKPDGYGGSDIYYCDWKNGYWGDPVNLGPDINTSKNEAYPFMNQAGELFFSSDGHPGLGGKDIFVTKEDGEGWHKPVRLDAPINSTHDDFGILTDTTMSSGYFSSNRDRTIDIYSFNTLKQPVWFSTPQKQNSYCVNLKDESSIEVDTLFFQYQWDFGNDIKQYGNQVLHCFPKSGSYTANVNVVDRRTKEIFFHRATYQIDIVDSEQPYINSKDYAIIGETVSIDGLKTNFPNHHVESFYWQLNDTSFKQGAQITYQYEKEGEHIIKLGVTLKSKITGELEKQAVSKKIHVFTDKNHLDKYLEEHNNTADKISEVTNNFKVDTLYRADKTSSTENVFRLQLLSSEKKVSLDSSVFRTVPSHYKIRELFDASDNKHIYIIDEKRQLTSIYPAYKNIQENGFNGAIVTYDALTDPSEKELFRLSKKYSLQLDDFFNSRNTLMTNGVLMLNKIVDLMNKYPDIKIEVEVHTDNMASTSKNLFTSKSLANTIVDYIAGSGINKDRLTPSGKGELYPIRSNLLDSGRALNRRVEFTILQ